VRPHDTDADAQHSTNCEKRHEMHAPPKLTPNVSSPAHSTKQFANHETILTGVRNATEALSI
jgi:hypothetical protein